ncbi:unnamed protein product, partial [Brassica rapa subsp. trilocularis]
SAAASASAKRTTTVLIDAAAAADADTAAAAETCGNQTNRAVDEINNSFKIKNGDNNNILFSLSFTNNNNHIINILPSHLKGSPSTSSITQERFKGSSKLLDLLLRDYTLNSFKNQHYTIKTGVLRRIHLPYNYSGINLDAIRFRCGSLRRYGAQLQEIHIGVGAVLEPCGERLVVVRQILGLKWSDIYYKNYDLSGYRLISPVLGLLAYNAINDVVLDGKVTFAGEVKPYVCAVKTNGHFGLVVTDDQDLSKSDGG